MTGGGTHIWSGEALSDCEILFIPGNALRKLVASCRHSPSVFCRGLAAKVKCYSAMAQMLGTRSAIERLAQFLINLGNLHGVRDGRAIIVNAKVTHDQIAAMIGSTRQWVVMMMNRFQKEGVLTVTQRHIRIKRPAASFLRDAISLESSTATCRTADCALSLPNALRHFCWTCQKSLGGGSKFERCHGVS
jgi:CRP/FNR family cyclic AMP-dependent transcriptional regulator